MRRDALLVMAAWMVLALVPVPAGAQSWVAAVFPERAFDFGTVARGSKLRHAFKLVNTTNQEIHIADWQTKCGCTDVRVGARDVPPGTQTVIEATVDTTRFQGYKASGLRLVLDRPQFAEIDLNLTCFIRADVMLSPGQVDFGVVARGTAPPPQKLTLSYLGGQPGWGVTKMQTISAHVSAQLQEVSQSAGGAAQYELTAKLDPNVPTGYFKDEITLLTNDPASPKIPISVSAHVQSAVTVSPSILNLGRLRRGQVVKKVVFVRSSKPFQVTDMKSAKGDELSASSPGGDPKPAHPVTITFTAPSQLGPYNGVLEIGTDLQDEPPAKLTAFATVVP